ncbi:MAG: AMP-binding protein [Bacteroidales bacterium]|nr:AMP-binding protein [Bacteroidales bacterium]
MPLQNNYHGLILNNRIIPVDDLQDFSETMISDGSVPEWQKKVFSFILDWVDDREYIEQLSSGTTGIPKQLQLSKQSMVESAEQTCKYFDITFGQTSLLCLPIEYIAGKMMVIRAFVGGMNLLIAEPSSMPDLTGFGQIDFCAMVPLQVYNSLNNVDTLRKIRKLIIGGGEIRDELEVMLRDMPNEVYASYGMAETCSHVAIRRISGMAHERFYRAIPGVMFSTDDRNCLKISASFLEADVVTNDVVDLIDRTSFRWIGRYDNLINSGGVKIVPEEIEALVSKTTGLDCAVIGLPDQKLGEKVILVLEKGGEDINHAELKTLLEEELPKHAQPKEIILLDELPRNHSFKVDRNKLKQDLSS